ncbi:MAG: hypothetical protein WD354_04380 [Acidimicrobiia bacterium]
MLGRKEYAKEEYEDGKAAVAEQLDFYKKLASVIDNETDKSKVRAAFEDFRGPFFNNMILMLDRPFVHRLRQVTGKDSNPLNEVEMLCDSLINNKGILREKSPIEYDPDESVVGLDIGDKIRLTAEEFERLSEAFFADLKSKFL